MLLTIQHLEVEMTRSTRRGPWLPEEDQTLLQLVRTQGPNNWVRISQYMQHRSPKQCRERYHQNLKPSLNHEPISAHEGEQIELLVQEMGKRWAEIARRLGNRSDNAVKNWWNGSVNRRKRTVGVVSRGVGHRDSPISAVKYPAKPAMPPPFQRTGSSQSLPELGHMATSTDSSSWAPRPIVLPAPSVSDVLTSRHDYGRAKTELRLPALTGYDRAAISPTASEASYGIPFTKPPSLVSDNYSTYSISPRTIPSPRLSLLTPTGSAWTRRNSLGDEQYHHSSELPKILASYDRNNTPPSMPRDSRMNVSRLLA